MVTVHLICVGNLKEKYLKNALAEYEKRLGRFCKFNLIELPEHKVLGKLNDSLILQIKQAEGTKILEKVQGYVVLLEVLGKQLTSPQLAKKIEEISFTESTISFVIGGSYGVSDEVKQNANLLLSFSKMTFPHQLMRVIAIEQIYRAFTILNNMPYHK